MGNQQSQGGEDESDDRRRQHPQQPEDRDNVMTPLQSKLAIMGLSPQELQAKFPDKMKFAKSKSTPASTGQDTRPPTKPKLKPTLSSEHQGRKTVF
jgi:hypothetical protein